MSAAPGRPEGTRVSVDTTARIRALPCWRGPLHIAPLSGGMTNHNFLVSDAQGRFVVRLGTDLAEHGVLRRHELLVARAAHAIGISPEVVHAEPGLMVSRFIDGRTLQAADLRNPQYLAGTVQLLQRCHQQMCRQLQPPLPQFDVFEVVRAYGLTLQTQPAHLLQDRLAELLLLARSLEASVARLPPVFCHNDLLAANLIDDGARLWLIDWDYAGLGTPLFDLANLPTNNGLDKLLDTTLTDLYFGGSPPGALAESLRAMQLASLLREVLWGAVSACHRRVDFDYAAYTRGCLQRLDQHRNAAG